MQQRKEIQDRRQSLEQHQQEEERILREREELENQKSNYEQHVERKKKRREKRHGKSKFQVDFEKRWKDKFGESYKAGK